jgi:predicted fused transcriptional regulator/phosphomethylpyrimidine kinase/predicted transcriptional regulator
MVNQLLPALRSLISQYLVEDHGFTQIQIAKVLGVTQASVSRGLRQLDRFNQYFTPGVKKAAKEFAETLATQRQALDESIEQLCVFCQSQKIGGLLCRLHRSENPELEACEVCIRGVAHDLRSDILENLLQGMEILRGSSTFTRLIPQVQSQLVMSLPDATNTDDVAGFPSRISIHNNQAHTFTGPEFGASKHLADILIQVQQYNPGKQAAIVTKYIEGMEKEFNQHNLRFIAVTRKKTETNADTDRALLLAISEALTSGKPFDVIIDKGFFGIEPVAYIFGKTAEIAAEKAISISKAPLRS